MRGIALGLAAILMAVSLMAAFSCGPTQETTPGGSTTVASTTSPGATTPPATTPGSTTTPATTAPSQTAKTPQYGGTVTLALATDILNWDEAYTNRWNANGLHLTNEALTAGDWTKGLAGNGEKNWASGSTRLDLFTGLIAESWEVTPDGLTVHLRDDVHFQNIPPVNGRQVTAQDVVTSIKRQFDTPTGTLAMRFKPAERPKSIVALDNSTVKFDIPLAEFPNRARAIDYVLDYVMIFPKEVFDTWGDTRDWRHVIGTGPFTVEDFVPANAATFKKNPTYWQKDPVGPGKGNQLPYVDGVKMLIVTDLATRIAALRAGKVDYLAGISYSDWNNLKQQRPDLTFYRTLAGNADSIFMRTDNPDLPFKDKRVRQALYMAVDFNKIVKEYYSGQAEFPVQPVSIEDKGIFTPVDQLPQAARDLYTYNPDKARQLLKDAGYPTGFTAEVIGIQTHVDMLSLIQGYWSAIGVNINMNIKETGVWNSISNAQTHKEMLMRFTSRGFHESFLYWHVGLQQNLSIVNDPVIETAYNKIWANFFDNEVKTSTLKEIVPYIIEQAYVFVPPAPYVYTMWWPWVQNYHGETVLGHDVGNNFIHFIWIDQSLKK